MGSLINGSYKAMGLSVAAAAFLGAGAFTVSAVWLQVINPALAEFEEPHGPLWYILGTCLAVALLTVVVFEPKSGEVA